MGSFLLHAVDVDGSVIPAIQKQSLETKGTVQAETSSGKVYPEFAHLVSQDPTSEFDTKAIATAWALCGLTGLDVGNLSAGVDFYEKLLADGGGIAAGAVHRRIRVKDGLLFPTQLTVSDREDATLTYSAVITYDTTNAPYLITESVALPAVAADTEMYSLAKLAIGGVTIDKLKNWTLDFGVETFVDTTGGAIWPIEVSITAIKPKLTIRSGNPAIFAAAGIPLVGKAATHANTKIYLRRRADSGFVADNVASHICLTMDGYAHLTSLFSADGSKPGETAMELIGRFDGTNAPVVLTSGVVIP